MTNTRIRLAFLAVAATFTGLSGCAAPVGDFGRRDQSVYANVLTDAVGPLSHVGADNAQASFAFTDEERELRNRGWTLVRPPDRAVPGNAEFEFHWWQALPDAWYGGYPESYYVALMNLPVASHETRYERVTEAARMDGDLMPPFRDVAMRVAKADGARRGALTALAADRALRGEAEARIAENIGVVRAVCRAIDYRIKAYRYALGRLMIETPSVRSVEAEAAIDALRWELGPCNPAGQIGAAYAETPSSRLPRQRFVPRSGVNGTPGPLITK